MTDLQTPVAVYVPAEHSRLGIDPASGIVGTPKVTETGQRVLIDYEGNRFRAVNVETFADRCNVAHARHAMNYPTVARAFADADELIEVGTFHRVHGRVEVKGGRGLVALAKWIGLWNEPECICTDCDDPNDHRKDCPAWGIPTVDTDALARELRCTRRVLA